MEEKLAVVYARYSCDKQTEQSIEGQLRVCNEFAERNGYTIIHNYIDRAVSGKTDRREEFQRMLKDSSRKAFSYVIVYKLDRFARNRYDSAINKALLKKNGIRVLSACEQITDTPEGIILSVLVSQYHISATEFNMVASFYVSPSIWEKWHIGRKAKESGIKILKEMGVIVSYRFNRNKYAPRDNSRIVNMYQFNIEKVKWLVGCVKTVAVYEEREQEERNEERDFLYGYDDIMEDVYGFIGCAA